MNDAVETLKEYKKLLDNEIITQEEFDAKKKEILGAIDEINTVNNHIDRQASGFAGTSQTTHGAQINPKPQVQQEQDTGSMGWGVLGFFLPLVGLILFLVWQDTRPKDAKMAGKGALIGVIVSIVCGIVFGCAGIVGASYYY